MRYLWSRGLCLVLGSLSVTGSSSDENPARCLTNFIDLQGQHFLAGPSRQTLAEAEKALLHYSSGAVIAFRKTQSELVAVVEEDLHALDLSYKTWTDKTHTYIKALVDSPEAADKFMGMARVYEEDFHYLKVVEIPVSSLPGQSLLSPVAKETLLSATPLNLVRVRVALNRNSVPLLEKLNQKIEFPVSLDSGRFFDFWVSDATQAQDVIFFAEDHADVFQNILVTASRYKNLSSRAPSLIPKTKLVGAAKVREQIKILARLFVHAKKDNPITVLIMPEMTAHMPKLDAGFQRVMSYDPDLKITGVSFPETKYGGKKFTRRVVVTNPKETGRLMELLEDFAEHISLSVLTE